MKKLMIAILMVVASSAHAGIFDRDSTNERPRLLVKTSALTLFNWRSELSYADIGAEIRLINRFTLASDIGVFYHSHWSGVPEYTNGMYADASLRYYPNFAHMRGYYLALHYRHQTKKSKQELDFTDAGLPYRKLIDVNRNSNFALVMFGSNNSFFFDRLYLDWNIGFGVEHRISDLKGLVSFEQEALETGEVEGVKYDDAEGRILPAYHFELKLGFKLF